MPSGEERPTDDPEMLASGAMFPVAAVAWLKRRMAFDVSTYSWPVACGLGWPTRGEIWQPQSDKKIASERVFSGRIVPFRKRADRSSIS
jgi:hypothetical protein